MTDWTFDPTDTLSISDALVSAIAIPTSDSLTMTDSLTKGVEIPITDSLHIKQTYTRDVTISASMVEAELQNFPVLISLTDDSLKSVSNGGHVNNVNGYDILFYLNGEKLSHEIDTYDATTGSYTAWVRIPVLIETGDTVLKMEYGDSASVNPSTTAVWDANYVAVYHMNDVTTSSIKDSTSNANNGTKKGANEPIQVDGKIGKGQDFDGSDDFISTTNLFNLSTWTISLIVKPSLKNFGELITFGNSDRISEMITYSDGRLAVSFGDGSTWGTEKVYAAGTISNNAFNYLTLNRNVSDLVSLYKNSSFISSFTNIYDIVNRKLNFGKRGNNVYFLDGIIDEVRVSNLARSADWIKTEYRNQNSPSSYLTLGAETCSILADYGIVFSDTLTMLDSEVRDFSSITSDIFIIWEDIADNNQLTRDFSSVTSDTLTMSDSHTKGVTMPITDSLLISDIVVNGVGIPISDTLLMHEAITKGVGVVVTDSFSIIDSFVKNELRKLIVKSKFKQGKKYTSTSES